MLEILKVSIYFGIYAVNQDYISIVRQKWR